MAISDGYKKNLETLRRAAVNDDLVLIEGMRVADRQPVVLLAARQDEADGSTMIVPFAEMCSGNPYEMYYPPHPDGGYMDTKTGEPVAPETARGTLSIYDRDDDVVHIQYLDVVPDEPIYPAASLCMEYEGDLPTVYLDQERLRKVIAKLTAILAAMEAKANG